MIGALENRGGQMAWYVVQTKPNSERKAARELRAVGLRVHLPRLALRRRNRSGIEIEGRRFKPLFAGYLLVRFPPALHVDGQPRFDLVPGHQLPLRWAYGADRELHQVPGGTVEHAHVARLLCCAADGEARPLALPDREVRDYLRRQHAHAYDAAAIERLARQERRARFQPGRSVRINEGPFAGFLSTIVAVDGDAVRLLLDIFGRETMTTVEIGQLEPG
jgi:transcription antitermination factor NusG